MKSIESDSRHITGLKTAIQQLTNERTKLYTILENNYNGVFELNLDGTIAYANAAFCTLYESDLSFLQKQHIGDVIQSVKLTESIQKILSGKSNFIIMRFRCKTKSRKQKYLEIRLFAKIIAEKRIIAGIISDRTDSVVLLKHYEGFIENLFQMIREIKIETKGTIYHLAKLAEIHDYSTGKHLQRIEHFARKLGYAFFDEFRQEMPYVTEEYVEDLAVSSVLHDVGKVGIPSSILLKPEPLSEDEFEMIKQHTVLVDEALKEFKGKKDFLSLGREIACCHHERWDGSGYPRGLSGESIPLCARIIAICDVYDALISIRPYKEAYSHQKAVDIIFSEKGKHFDPKVVDVFSKIHKEFELIKSDLS